jgi:hypothetical protein
MFILYRFFSEKVKHKGNELGHGLLENGFEVMDADGYVLFFGRPNTK